jgi:signal transduction histidine kinase
MSLNKRLSAGLAVSLAILLSLQWAAMSFVFSHLSQQQLVNRLSQDAENLLAGIEFDQNKVLSLDAKRVSAVYQRPLSGHYYWIIAGEQKAFSRSLWDVDLSGLDALNVTVGVTKTLHIAGPQKQKLLVQAQGYRKNQQAITIAVAEDLVVVNQALRQFQWVYGAISLFILIALLLIQRQIVLNSLKPLDDIRKSLSQLEAGKISQIESLAPTEIAPVIAEFNRLLKVTSNQSRRSRDALGNLAHALKTQLTILNQSVEQSRQTKLTQTIYSATAAMRHIVERELKRARLVGNSVPGRHVNVQDVVTLMVKTLQLMYAEKSPVIQLNVDDNITYVGDEEDFTELLGNVLDNACKWCKNGVYLTIKNTQKSLNITVEDDGAGCLVDKLDDLTRRGFRLDESTVGSGLGLAIVYDIVTSHAGVIQFSQSATYGGLSVNIDLPS